MRVQEIIYTKVCAFLTSVPEIGIAMVVWLYRIIETAHHHLQVTSGIISGGCDSPWVAPMAPLSIPRQAYRPKVKAGAVSPLS